MAFPLPAGKIALIVELRPGIAWSNPPIEPFGRQDAREIGVGSFLSWLLQKSARLSDRTLNSALSLAKFKLSALLIEMSLRVPEIIAVKETVVYRVAPDRS